MGWRIDFFRGVWLPEEGAFTFLSGGQVPPKKRFCSYNVFWWSSSAKKYSKHIYFLIIFSGSKIPPKNVRIVFLINCYGSKIPPTNYKKRLIFLYLFLGAKPKKYKKPVFSYMFSRSKTTKKL